MLPILQLLCSKEVILKLVTCFIYDLVPLASYNLFLKDIFIYIHQKIGPDNPTSEVQAENVGR